MLELGHAQLRYRDEVRSGSEASDGALGLLQQSVHRLHIRVDAIVQHAAHDPINTLL
jgi:hypothetical protein